MSKIKINKIKKILIANRGEIALRVMSTCKEMGIKTVSIFSEVDKNLPHVYRADEAYSLGDGDLRQTYLNQDLIIEIAKKAQADAIHPGYGFLSERSSFSKKVKEAGLIFIGPSSEVMSLMGDKEASKRKMVEIGVPCLPGYHDSVQEATFLRQKAKEIGYPLLIKASAGGGGKGMRPVFKDEDFLSELEGAKREALKAFGDDRVLLEKFIMRPRHIEMQVMSDQHGNHLHLFERECSIQRRNQKIVEESPSPAHFLTEEKRRHLYQVATTITREIGYEGAGTIEFLFDEKGNFYFLEMNTRLQVEHPVTEMVTGVDLVKMQIEVSEGQALKIKQEDLKVKGHAIEVRLYAEDAENNFMPTVGTIHYIGESRQRDTRLEIGYENGNEVTVNFDPMLAKLVVWGKDRITACEKMITALNEVLFHGLITNRNYLREVIKHPQFQKGDLSTHFVKDFAQDLNQELNKLVRKEEVPALLGAYLLTQDSSKMVESVGQSMSQPVVVEKSSAWNLLKNFRNV